MTRSDDRCLMALTSNEVGWIEFIRLLTDGTDPPPTLAAVQALRGELSKKNQNS